MFNPFKFLTGGIVKSIENIASEWIETDMESAQAKTLMIKTLDPNGRMRRDIASTVCRLYVVYIVVSLALILCQSFDLTTLVIIDDVEHRSVDLAVESVTDLFVPITTLFTVITSACFGVNAVNANKGV